MLCYYSGSDELPLLNQLATAVQATEDTVNDDLSENSLRKATVNQRSAENSSAESVKKFWSSARSLAKCLELQFEHQSTCQLFYQTLKEYEAALEPSFTAIRERLQHLSASGSKEEAKEILESTQRLLSTVLLWWRRADSLVSQSRRVVPMQARLEPTDFRRPGYLLVDYSASEGTLSANEEVFIIDSTNRDQWIVEASSGHRVGVPSLCVAISGPDPNAIERALALRLRLLANWTIALKELGRSFISFMLAIFRRLKDSKVEALTAEQQSADSGSDLYPLLGTMEQLLQSYWSDHPDFEELRERMRKARLSLTVFGTQDCIDDCTHIDINTIFLRMSPLVLHSSESSASSDEWVLMKQLLGMLIRKYQELAKYWEAYKLMTETSTDPNYLWMADEFQQLRRVNLSDLLEHMAQEDKDSWLDVLHLFAASKAREAKGAAATRYKTEVKIDVLEGAKRTTADGRVDSGISGDSGIGIAEARRPDSRDEAEFHNLQPKVKVRDRVAAYEDKVASAATGFMDDVFLTADELPGHTARLNKLPGNRRGSTTSSVWSSRCSVRSSSTAVGRSTEIEDFRREEVESKSRLVISCVVDTQDKTVLSLEEAIRKGVLNWKTGSYLNREANEWIPIQVALTKGLIIAESRTEGPAKVKKRRLYGMVTLRGGGGGGNLQQRQTPPPSPVIVTAVRDLQRGIRLEPAEAQSRGLANATLTEFLDTRANEWIGTDEACSREVIEFDLTAEAADEPPPQPQPPPERFMIYSALDVANGQPLSFQQAKERGVIDLDEGVYWNTETGEALELDVAIRKGFVRANRIASAFRTTESGVV